MKTSVVIPDAQLKPGEDLSRFTQLGHWIVENRPDAVIFLGDFGEFLSLSWWDRNKRLKMELRRYAHDVEVMKDALDLMFAPIDRFVDHQRRSKVKLYKPYKIWINGNHEAREYMYVMENPVMQHTVDFMRIIGLKDRYGFDEIVPYTKYTEYEGVLFTHIPGYVFPAHKAISGKYALAKAADIVDKSVVFGHLHRLEYLEGFKAGGNTLRQINVLSAGHFMAPDTFNERGFNGVVKLKHTQPGLFTFESVSTQELMLVEPRRYPDEA
jgi:predicted phosphodiesterase